MEKKRKNNQAIWLETDIEPIREFENKEFQRLLQYADENQKHLIIMLCNEHTDELKRGMMFGSSKLHYFENAISEDEKLLTVFKLGELYGHLKCMGTIEYESMCDNHALARLQIVTNRLPKLKNETQEILKFLYNKGNAKEQELLNAIKVKLVDLMQIMHILLISGIINTSDIIGYSLSDIGLRVAKQLNKQ